jgi:hypothetical protein
MADTSRRSSAVESSRISDRVRSSRIGMALWASHNRRGVKADLRGGLGGHACSCYGTGQHKEKGTFMAEEEPLLVSPPTQDVAMHVRDYARFTQLLKWSAIACLIIAFLVLLILK